MPLSEAVRLQLVLRMCQPTNPALARPSGFSTVCKCRPVSLWSTSLCTFCWMLCGACCLHSQMAVLRMSTLQCSQMWMLQTPRTRWACLFCCSGQQTLSERCCLRDAV